MGIFSGFSSSSCFGTYFFCFKTSFSCFRTSFLVLERPFPVLERPFPVSERHFPVLDRPFSVSELLFPGFWGVILSRDVPGQKSLSRDICSCPCPGTKGHRDKNFFFVTGQRDNGTSHPGLSRDVPSLGNTNLNDLKSPSFIRAISCRVCLKFQVDVHRVSQI